MRRRGGLILAATSGAASALVALFLSLASRERLDALCGAERSLLGVPIDCAKVTTSAYGNVFGVALSSWGFGFYVALVIVALVALSSSERARTSYRLLVLGAGAAMFYTLVLLVMQVVVLKALCLFCLVLYGGHALILTGTWLAAEHGLGGALKDAALLFRRLHREPLVAVAAAAMALSVFAVESAARAERPEPPAAEWLQELAQLAPMSAPVDLVGAASTGPDRAPYVVVVFSDFLCPFCRQAALDLEALRAAQPERLRVVFKHYPLDTACNPHVGRNLHPGACDAARAAVCAQWAGRFGALHDALFAAQAALVSGATREALLALGEQAGLSPAALAACMADRSSLDQVQRDIEEAQAWRVPGTPALILNGRPLFALRRAAPPVAALRTVMDAGLWQN